MIYSPSQALTELLSSYLEFDLKQLQLGVWSGDLQIKDVQLRRDAFFPLLNPPQSSSSTSSPFSRTNTQGESNDATNALNDGSKLHLLSGTIGQLHIQVPWRLLVNGSGRVDVEMSDIQIVLGFQSSLSETSNSEEEGPSDFVSSESNAQDHLNVNEEKVQKDREEKQRLIREAEKCLLYKMPIPPPKRNETNLNDIYKSSTDTYTQQKSETKMGLLERLMKGMASSLMWKVLCGLHVNIRNLNVVLVIDEVEIGMTFDSLIIGDNDIPINGNEDQKQNNFTLSLSKDIQFHRLGLFIRQSKHETDYLSQEDSQYSDCTKNTTLPQENNYILQPVDSKISIQIFNKLTEGTVDTEAKDVIVGKEISMEKVVDLIESNDDDDDDDDDEAFVDAKSEISELIDYDIFMDATDNEDDEVNRVDPNIELSLQNTKVQGQSVTNDSKALTFQQGELRLVAHWAIEHVTTIIIPENYNLISLFLCELEKVKNGRPSDTIQSCLENQKSICLDYDDYTLLSNLRTGNHFPPSSDKTKVVIKQWWQYVFLNVIREIRQRKKMIYSDKKNNVPFSVLMKQKEEYLECYSELFEPSNLRSSDEKILRKLWMLEDKLFVEQILLYRSIVRSKHLLPSLMTKRDPNLASRVRNLAHYDDLQEIQSTLRMREGHNFSHDEKLDAATYVSPSKTYGHLPPLHQNKPPSRKKYRERLTQSKGHKKISSLDTRVSSIFEDISGKKIPAIAQSTPVTSFARETEGKTTYFFSSLLQSFNIIVSQDSHEDKYKDEHLSGEMNEMHLSKDYINIQGVSYEVLLRVCLENVKGFLKGQSHSKRYASAFVRSVSLIGLGQTQLLRSQPKKGNQGRKNKTAFDEDFQKLDFELGSALSEENNLSHALSIYIISQNKSIMKEEIERETSIVMNVYKFDGKLDLSTIKSLGDFFTDLIEYKRPSHLLPPLSLEEVTKLFKIHTQHDFGSYIPPFENKQRIFVQVTCYGIDLLIPIESDSVANDCNNTLGSKETSARLIVSVEMINYFYEICSEMCPSSSSNFKLNKIKELSKATTKVSPDGLQEDSIANCNLRRKSSLSNISDLSENDSLLGCEIPQQSTYKDLQCRFLDLGTEIKEYPGLSSTQEVFIIHNLNVQVYDERSLEHFSILEYPFDIEILVSANSPKELNVQTSRRILASGSSVKTILSEKRLTHLSNLINSYNSISSRSYNQSKTNDLKSQSKLFHMNSVLSAINVTVLDFQVLLVLDPIDDSKQAMMNERKLQEIIFEECISDFLSQYACFDLESPINDSIEMIMFLCRDRLCELGLTIVEAQTCIECARLTFLENVAEVLGTFNPDDTKEHSDLVQMDISQSIGTVHENDKINLEQSYQRMNDESASILSQESLESDVFAEESFDIIETAMKNAIEVAREKVLCGLKFKGMQKMQEVLTLAMESPQISMLRFLRTKKYMLSSGAILLQNATGIKLLAVYSSEHHILKKSFFRSSISSEEMRFNEKFKQYRSYHAEQESAVFLSSYERQLNERKDSAISKSSKRNSNELQELNNHTLIMHNADITFVAVDWENILDTIIPLKRHIYLRKNHVNDPQSDKIVSSADLSGKIGDISLKLLSNNLAPFMAFKLKETSMQYLPSKEKSIIKAQSKSINLQNLTPEGIFFSDVLLSNSIDEGKVKGDPAIENFDFSLKIVSYRNFWNRPREIFLKFSEVQYCLLRQFLNEMLQFLFNARHGFGYLMNKFYGQIPLDPNGNPPPPIRYEILFLNSVILLPRDSVSTELLALHSEKVAIFNSFHDESWNTAVPQQKDDSSQDSSSLNSTGHAEEDSFFDCMSFGSRSGASDEYDQNLVHLESMNTKLSSSQQKENIKKKTDTFSSFDKNKVPRINVSLKHFHLLAALGGSLGLERKAIPHGFHIARTKKIECGKCVYETRENLGKEWQEFYGRHEAYISELLSRRWERVSKDSMEWEIFAEFLPQLRILVRDHAATKFDMSMSQFYLCLSVWYGNMQELPVMFPYSEKDVEAAVKMEAIPETYPEYGTAQWVNYMKNALQRKLNLDLSLQFHHLEWTCKFDDTSYFSSSPWFLYLLRPESNSEKIESILPGAQILFRNVHIQVKNEKVNLLRLGCVCENFQIIDNRSHKTRFSRAIGTANDFKEDESIRSNSRATNVPNMDWGLNCGRHTLLEELPFPFQLTIFMTPDKWCSINLGIQSLNGALDELSLIWMLLDYFGLYFQIKDYGNPYFVANDLKETIKGRLKSKNSSKILGSEIRDGIKIDEDVLNLDIRLWFNRPHIILPSKPTNLQCPCILLESDSGMFYRYKSIGKDFSSQEVCSKDMSIAMLQKLHESECARSMRGISSSKNGIETIVDGLNFSFKYDANISTNHSNIFFRLPLHDDDFEDAATLCGIEPPKIQPDMVQLVVPSIVGPSSKPLQDYGNFICNISGRFENIKLCLDVFSYFLKVPGADKGTTECIEVRNYTSCFSASIAGIRLLLTDTVLSAHLPVAVIHFPSVIFNSTQLSHEENTESDDLQIILDVNVWGSYWNMNLKSWEPMLEPYQCLISYENSFKRGQGLAYYSESPFHLNISNALIETFDQAMNSFSVSMKNWLHTNDSESVYRDLPIKQTIDRKHFSINPKESTPGNLKSRSIEEPLETNCDLSIVAVHNMCHHLNSDERVAFSLLNLTGERIRVHRHANSTFSTKKETNLTYLDHTDRMKLNFEATMSVPLNLSLAEVPFNQGFLYCDSGQRNRSHFNLDKQLDLSIDVQVPGFRWLSHIGLDVICRQFVPLDPLEHVVERKIKNDWRLQNVLQLYTETYSYNGGRQISFRSPFQIINNTSHPLDITIHPDPTVFPISKSQKKAKFEANKEVDNNDADDGGPCKNFESSLPIHHDEQFVRLEPESTFHIPILLLESALRMQGNHLGSIWFSPSDESIHPSAFEHLSDDIEASGLSDVRIRAGYSSRPVQLAKLVHESSITFDKKCTSASEIINESTGMQIICPVFQDPGTELVSPFCFAVEVQRSPLIRDRKMDSNIQAGVDNESNTSFGPRNSASHITPHDEMQDNYTDNTDGNTGSTRKEKKQPRKGTQHEIHAPITYSLIIHPPIIIENLLCEGGTFELMHAFRKTIVWRAHLDAGESVPIHTVGLDAPLYLLINLKYCRTPHGKGALIHDGQKGIRQGNQTGWNSIERAVWKSKNTLNRVKANIDKIAMAPIDSGSRQRSQESMLKSYDKMQPGKDDGSGGYNVDFIATEALVVDDQGQSLSLSLNNVVGGGGQRRVSVYSPFWIVNLTEHALKYKHDSNSSFVSGTYHFEKGKIPNRDETGLRNRKRTETQSKTESFSNRPKPSSVAAKIGTIFSGTKGALATTDYSLSLSECSLLMANEYNLETMSKLGFMFNFHELPPINQRKIYVQLSDREYVSDWSGAINLESIGVTQTVGMHCKNGRALELSVVVSVAPGPLSRFTKIIRFFPRYVLVNQLDRPIRIWQDSSLLHSNFSFLESGFHDENESSDQRIFRKERTKEAWMKYEYLFYGKSSVTESKIIDIPSSTLAHRSALHIATAGKYDCIPFHLPDTRKDRQLRLDYGFNWYLSPSFPADVIGEYVLRLKRYVDPNQLEHVTTRASSQYDVILPPIETDGSIEKWDGELGIWFETTWGQKEILVKGTKNEKFSYNNTDIHVGDQLLKVNGFVVKDFAETMKLLKDHITSISEQYSQRNKKTNKNVLQSLGTLSRTFQKHENVIIDDPKNLVLTFRTLEERMRRLRKKAKQGRRTIQFQAKPIMPDTSPSQQNETNEFANTQSDPNQIDTGDNVAVEMKLINQSVFVVLKPYDKENPPYRVENRSVGYRIYFRQRGCDGHRWEAISPGETTAYIWEEPMKPKKLLIRAAVEKYKGHHRIAGNIRSNKLDYKKKKRAKFFHFVENEEQGYFGPTRTIKLEVIGFEDTLPCPVHSEAERRNEVIDNGRNLICRVDTEGGVRVLVISEPRAKGRGDLSLLKKHLNTLNKRLKDEEIRKKAFQDLKIYLPSEIRSDRHMSLAAIHEEENNDPSRDVDENIVEPSSAHVSLDVKNKSVEDQLRDISSDYPEGVALSRRNQVFVEVLEAVGLKSSHVIGLSNPFCKITFRVRNSGKKRQIFKLPQTRSTYFIEKANNPKWSAQTFVFDVPASAIKVTRGHVLQVKVFNFSFVGNHTLLGQTNIQLQALRQQNEIEGWYPLTGRSRRASSISSMDVVRGSIRLRAHWIYTIPALLDYYILLSNRRLSELKRSKEGMEKQFVIQKKFHNSVHSTKESFLFGLRTGNEKKLKLKFMNQKVLRKKTPRNNETKITWSDENQDKLESQRKIKKKARNHSLLVLSRETAESREKRYKVEDAPLSPGRNFISKGFEIVQSPIQSSLIGNDAQDRSFARDANDTFSTRQSLFSRSNSDIRMFLAPVLPLNLSAYSRAAIKKKRSFDSASVSALHETSDISRDSSVLSINSSLIVDEMKSTCDGSINKTHFEENYGDYLKLLFSKGFLYRQNSDSYFHRKHMNHGILDKFATISSETITASPNPMLPSSINLAKSWTFAYLFVNDLEISNKLKGSRQQSTSNYLDQLINPPLDEDRVLKPSRESLKIDTSYRQSQFKAALQAIELPGKAPSFMKEEIERWAEKLSNSRDSFTRSAKRSLQSAMNSGGRLTIRPITTRNLSDNGSGMYIKLNFGNTVLTTSTVEAKIEPVWSDSKEQQGFYLYDGKAHENDLQVDIYRLTTSGTMYISIYEEKLNSDVEIGILHIPVAGAIKCCSDYTKEFESNRKKGKPMYTRWFPLINPKDCVPVEGDMGLSCEPAESEQTDDLQFSQRYLPCLKLSLVWEPFEETPRSYINISGPISSKASAKKSIDSLSYLDLSVKSLSAALIDSYQGIELLSLSATYIDIRYAVANTKTRTGFSVGWLQIDHQANQAVEPVVLAPSQVTYPQPTVQILAEENNLRSNDNTRSFDYIFLLLEELDIRVEEAWLFDVWNFVMNAAKKREIYKKSKGPSFHDKSKEQKKKSDMVANEIFNEMFLFENEDKISKNTEREQGKKIYIELLELGSFKVNFSYSKRYVDMKDYIDSSLPLDDKNDSQEYQGMSKGHPIDDIPSTKRRVNSDVFQGWSGKNSPDISSSFEGIYGYNLPSIVSILPSITGATIRMQSKTLKHVFETVDEIGESLKSYYANEILRQIYKIIGSLDLVGNPSMALSSIFTGVRDFFFEPSMALLNNNPSEVGVGFVRGSLSLVSNSASGVLGLASKLSGSAGNLAAILSMDEKFQRKHKEDLIGYAHTRRTFGSRNILYMTSRPIKDILKGVTLAATGVITEPYRGAKKRGLIGFTKGVGIGTIGVVAKPLVGVLDAFSHATDSIQHIAKSVNLLDKKTILLQKRRLSYVFGYGNLLLPYDQVTAHSAELLRRLPLRAGKGNPNKKVPEKVEELLIIGELLSISPGEDIYIVLSSKRLVVFVVKTDSGIINASVRCSYTFRHNLEISSHIENEGYNGVALYITENRIKDSGQALTSPTKDSGRGIDVNSSFPTLRKHKRINSDEKQIYESRRQEVGSMNNKVDSSSFHTIDYAFYGKKVRVIMGEFRHRPQLARVHNAVCCLFQQFDRVVSESIVNTTNLEEVFQFGHMRFQKMKKNNGNSLMEQKLSVLKFYSELSNASWLVNTKNGELTLNDGTSSTYDENVEKAFGKEMSWLEASFFNTINSPKLDKQSLHSKASFLENEETNIELESSLPSEVSSIMSPVCSKATMEQHKSPPTSEILSSLPTDITKNRIDYSSDVSASESRLLSRLDKVEAMLETLLENQSTNILANVSESVIKKNETNNNESSSRMSSLGNNGVEDNRNQKKVQEGKVLEFDSQELLLKEIQSLREQVGTLTLINENSQTRSLVSERSSNRKKFSKLRLFLQPKRSGSKRSQEVGKSKKKFIPF